MSLESPGIIEVDDTRFYEGYDREFLPGERVFWLKLPATVVCFHAKAKQNLPPGFDRYRIKLDDLKEETVQRSKLMEISTDKHGLVEVFRAQLRLMDSAVMHALVS